MKYVHSLSRSGKKRKGWTAISFQPAGDRLGPMKKQELMLLKNDWLKKEHWIKINSCPARLK